MQLNYKKFGEGFPLIILHGVLGSLDNWQSIAKKLAVADLTQPLAVYILDQRNHGKSPHTAEFSYELLAQDLLEFCAQQHISKTHLMGHSMGGKVAMKFALEHPEMVGKLIVVDISPRSSEDHNASAFEALQAADVHHADTREQVRESLRKILGDDETTIQFLMKGLTRDAGEKHFEWKFNLDSLVKNYELVYEPINSAIPYTGETLFIKGAKSDYINASNFHEIVELFPNHQLVEIEGAGHWVHADKPDEFLKAVKQFLGREE